MRTCPNCGRQFEESQGYFSCCSRACDQAWTATKMRTSAAIATAVEMKKQTRLMEEERNRRIAEEKAAQRQALLEAKTDEALAAGYSSLQEAEEALKNDKLAHSYSEAKKHSEEAKAAGFSSYASYSGVRGGYNELDKLDSKRREMYKKKYKEQIESLPESQRKKYKKYYYSEESKFITGDIGLGLSLFSPINIFISIFTQTIPIIISSAILVFQLINLLYWFSLRKKVPEGLVVKNQSIRDGYSIRSYCANNILWYGISFYSFLVSIRKITGIGFLKAIPFALVLYSFFELLFPNTYAYEHGALFSTKSHFGKECKTDKIVSILNLSTGIILSVLVLCI